MIYLDYNSTAPYSPSVREFIKNEMGELWANPAAAHPIGTVADQKLAKSREAIAHYLGTEPSKLIFTSGATESINTVLNQRHLEKLGVRAVIFSPTEHSATLKCLKILESTGFKTVQMKLDEYGLPQTKSLFQVLETLGPSLVTVSWVNNETGTIAPIKELREICTRFNALLHLDAAQALGKLPIDIQSVAPDFASFSGHKIGALKSIGILYARTPENLMPLIYGGGQEGGLRSGTTNLAAVRSLELAISDVDFNAIKDLQIMRDGFEAELTSVKSAIKINCASVPRVYNTSNIYLGGASNSETFAMLSQKGICVSLGSACNSGSFEPSHVLLGMGRSHEYARSCLRVSIGRETTAHDLQTLMKALQEISS